MLKKIETEDVIWAWSKAVTASVKLALVEAIPLACIEVMRTDEIGLVTAAGRQVVLIRHQEKRVPKGNFNALASQDFSGFGWSNLFEFLQMPGDEDVSNREIVAGFELLLYRPKPGQLYTPLKYSSYKEAVEGCDRQLFFIMGVTYAQSMGTIVYIAQVTEVMSRSLFKNRIKDPTMAIAKAVDGWVQNVYSDEMGETQYNKLASFPLAQPPADSDDDFDSAPTIQLESASWNK